MRGLFQLLPRLSIEEQLDLREAMSSGARPGVNYFVLIVLSCILATLGLLLNSYIEATIFGYPVMKVNEWYLDSKARMELPVGVIENEPKIDMAANLALWGESVQLPSILVTDPRVRWEAIDDTTARLVAPFGDEEDTFTVTFDPQTGLIHTMEAMRYREATDEAKIPWRNEPLGWQIFHGIEIPSPAAVTWLDEGTTWSVWTIEDVVYNVDVSEYIRAKGIK